MGRLVRACRPPPFKIGVSLWAMELPDHPFSKQIMLIAYRGIFALNAGFGGTSAL